MNVGLPKTQYESMLKNIEEIKATTKNPPDLNSPQSVKIIERTKYLFYGLTKSLIDIGNSILEEQQYRKPRNNADVFISLAEHDILKPSLVPGLKKAVLSMSRISTCEYNELLTIASASIDSIHKCLDNFAVFLRIKTAGSES